MLVQLSGDRRSYKTLCFQLIQQINMSVATCVESKRLLRRKVQDSPESHHTSPNVWSSVSYELA